MLQDWPVYREALAFPQEERAIETVMEAISAIRSRRAEMNVPPSNGRLLVATSQREAFQMGAPILKRLGYGSEVELLDNEEIPAETQGMVTVTTYAARIMMPLAELVDLDKERVRLAKEIQKNQAELLRSWPLALTPALSPRRPKPWSPRSANGWKSWRFSSRNSRRSCLTCKRMRPFGEICPIPPLRQNPFKSARIIAVHYDQCTAIFYVLLVPETADQESSLCQ